MRKIKKGVPHRKISTPNVKIKITMIAIIMTTFLLKIQKTLLNQQEQKVL